MQKPCLVRWISQMTFRDTGQQRVEMKSQHKSLGELARGQPARSSLAAGALARGQTQLHLAVFNSLRSFPKPYGSTLRPNWDLGP